MQQPTITLMTIRTHEAELRRRAERRSRLGVLRRNRADADRAGDEDARAGRCAPAAAPHHAAA